MVFTKRKFKKFHKEKQHKKCAEILRHIYESLLTHKPYKEMFSHYHDIENWLDITSLEDNIEKISDRYHWHLRQANHALKEHNLLPSIRRHDREAKEDFLPNAIFLDNVRSAYNVGSILRTAEALRIGHIHFSKNTPYKDNDKVIKTSMGASAYIPCHPYAVLTDLPRPYVALETAHNATSVHEFIFPQTPFTLILGNEEYGISDEVLKEVDYIVDIPMLGIKNSINIGCAFSIAASEIRRQQILTKKNL